MAWKTDGKKEHLYSYSYNHLNLPEHITFDNGNSIQYIYDAAGVKLSKVVTENSTSTTTDYIGGIVYEGGVRKFISTEEGRIMLEESTPEYQYHLKDHLGNVRLTFTTTEQASTYLATMELAATSLEELTFDNISGTQHQDVLYNHTTGGAYSSRLNVADSKVMGPAMSLHVMPGDEINMSVYAKYTQAASSADPVGGMAAIIAASAGVGAVTEAAQVTAGLNDILGAGQAAVFSTDDAIPKAYINYLFFDKNKQYQSGGFQQVSTAALNSFEALSLDFFPDEEGYMIIYVANQTDEDLNVYFDDMAIEHIEGPIVQTDDYYPFGLTFNSSERSGYTSNKFLFLGQELQDELDLNWVQFKYRNHDPTIGRFFSVDPLTEEFPNQTPFQFASNNPIWKIELEGLEGIPTSGEDYVNGFGYGVSDQNGGGVSHTGDYKPGITDKVVGAISSFFGAVHNGISNTVADGVRSMMGTAEYSNGLPSTNDAIQSGDENAFYASTANEQAALHNATPDVVGEVVATGVEVVAAEALGGAKTGSKAKPKGMNNPKVKAAAAKGRAAHKSFANKVKAKNGWTSEPQNLIDPATGKKVIPDALTPSGVPVELKPNTSSGKSQGKRQIKKYERATGEKGRVIYY